MSGPNADPQLASVLSGSDPELFERQNVHHIYQKIASHFSDTRYKPWPVVEEFLQDLPFGAVGSDVGCGNGKYLDVKSDLWIIGNDQCENLLRLASHSHSSDLAVVNNLSLPFVDACLDFVISIAVIHHLSTEERRLRALQELVRVVMPGGKILVFVWAFEQGVSSKRAFTQQDSLVGWKLRLDGPSSSNSDQVYRYYHLFKQGELQALVSRILNVRVLKDGYDRDNWWIILEKTAF